MSTQLPIENHSDGPFDNKTSVQPLTKFRVASFYFAAVFVVFALFGLFTRGLNLGLDFTGGYLTEFTTCLLYTSPSPRDS